MFSTISEIVHEEEYNEDELQSNANNGKMSACGTYIAVTPHYLSEFCCASAQQKFAGDAMIVQTTSV